MANTKKQGKDAGKAKKLQLSKETVNDLTARDRQAKAVRGGANRIISITPECLGGTR